MKANIAYKFELMPTREQKRIFAQAAGCRRFVWNKAIELQKRCLEQEVPFLKYTELAGRLVLWKKEDDMLWLQEAPSQALQQCLMDASAAIQAFKAKKKVHLGSPWNAALTFKKKSGRLPPRKKSSAHSKFQADSSY